jgi:predicted nucleic acid-binding protein
MTLVDTSIWIDHLRRSSKGLAKLLEEDRVLTHSFVIGELALAGLVHRDEVLGLVAGLPRATEASDEEVLNAVRQWKLDGRGVGWVDVHLFVSAQLSASRLWTTDRRLAEVCTDAGVAFVASS